MRSPPGHRAGKTPDSHRLRVRTLSINGIIKRAEEYNTYKKKSNGSYHFLALCLLGSQQRGFLSLTLWHRAGHRLTRTAQLSFLALSPVGGDLLSLDHPSSALQVHSFFNMRAPLLPLTRRAVFSPIETIVCFAIIGTLAYFHVLSAIKHSAFFAPTLPSTLRTAHALLRDGEWVGVDADWYGRRKADPNSRAVELQQVIFSSQSVAVQSEDAVSSVIRSCLQGY